MRVWSVIRHKTLGAVSGVTLTLMRDISALDDKVSTGVYRDQSVCLPSGAFISASATVFYAFRGSAEARLRNARTGELEYKLPIHSGACITALAICQEYYVCAARGNAAPQSASDSSSGSGSMVTTSGMFGVSTEMSAVSLLLYSRKTVTFVRRLVGCRYDQVRMYVFPSLALVCLLPLR